MGDVSAALARRGKERAEADRIVQESRTVIERLLIRGDGCPPSLPWTEDACAVVLYAVFTEMSQQGMVCLRTLPEAAVCPDGMPVAFTPAMYQKLMDRVMTMNIIVRELNKSACYAFYKPAMESAFRAMASDREAVMSARRKSICSRSVWSRLLWLVGL
jgi:hypothetical protein